MRVVSETERATHPNEASVRRGIRAERDDTLRSHIEEARVHEHEPGVRRGRPPMENELAGVRGSCTYLQGSNARVCRDVPRLHPS